MTNFKKLWLYSLFVKLFLAAVMPLSLDESYYWTWGHNLQLSYFDHPPFVSWLFLIAQPFDDFFRAVRWPGVLLGHLTLLVWYNILKDHLTNHRLNWFLLLALLAPLTGPGSLIITPDIPLVFFWSFGLLYYKKSLAKPNYVNYSILGAVLGLGFCSKYHMALFLPFALTSLAIEKKYTVNLIKKIIVGFVLFLIFSSPVWIWNYQNDFVSFKFQMNHGLGASSWHPSWTIRYLLEQLLIIFPLIFYVFLRSKKLPNEISFIKHFAWLGLCFFFLTSFKGSVEANWTIFSALPILAIVAYSYEKSIFLKISASFWVLIFSLFLVEVHSPILANKFPTLKTNEAHKFTQLIHKIKELDPNLNIYARTYQMSGKLSFELKRNIYKLKGMNRVDYFDFREESLPSSNKKNFLIIEKQEKAPTWLIKKNYKFQFNKKLTEKYSLVEIVKND